jgi:hypothetical protein
MIREEKDIMLLSIVIAMDQICEGIICNFSGVVVPEMAKIDISQSAILFKSIATSRATSHPQKPRRWRP